MSEVDEIAYKELIGFIETRWCRKISKQEEQLVKSAFDYGRLIALKEALVHIENKG